MMEWRLISSLIQECVNYSAKPILKIGLGMDGSIIAMLLIANGAARMRRLLPTGAINLAAYAFLSHRSH